MNESFRKLAILYFEGRITPNQECELFGFIARSAGKCPTSAQVGI